MIIFNEGPEDIVKEKHICFYTVDQDFSIKLMEVVDVVMKHPKAKEYAFINKLDTRHVKTLKRTETKATSAILLEAAQNNFM